MIRVLICVSLAIALVFAGECTETNCGNPTCYVCTTVGVATFWKDCGSTDKWGTVPSGTVVLRYNPNTPCSACTSDRVNARVMSGSQWGFFAMGDLGHCAPRNGEASEMSNSTSLVGCPSAGEYTVKQAHTLRGQPVGIQCGMLEPGDKFNFVKPDPSCSWCYGQASGALCSDITTPCAGCWGWTECSAIE